MNWLVKASLRHYRGLHALVIVGVAVAVAVLAGALLVGASVRGSLRAIALGRLGQTDVVISSTSFFREAVAREMPTTGIAATAPVLAMTGAVLHEESRRAAARVQMFGIDDRFTAFHGHAGHAPENREAWISQGLALELGAAVGDDLLLRVAKPTDIPLSNLQGRRDDASERIRLRVARVLDRSSLGEFSLLPSQGPALTLFVPLSRLQQDLDLAGEVNAILVDAAADSSMPEIALASARASFTQAATLHDFGLKVRRTPDNAAWILESRTGLLDARIEPRVRELRGEPLVGTLTYLANSIRARGREIPYSLIAALDLGAYERLGGQHAATPSAPSTMSATTRSTAAPLPPIRLNEWAAADLGVVPGDRVEVEYYLWSDQDGLRTEQAPFSFAGTVPMDGAGGDRSLTPEYPGITDARDVTSWDPPFPVDLKKVRPEDEDYWDRWQSAPKAFIPLEVGQRLWPSPFGNLSSLRTPVREDTWPPRELFDPFSHGLTARHARAEALAAADGTTDFGEYFVYFSFFLVVAALLLAGLFFALGIEQRARELGVLAAVGFRPVDLRRTLLMEAFVLAAAGSAIGVAGAIGYAALIMYGLRTWWVGAVNTTSLELHLDPAILLAGTAGALVASMAALWLSFRRVSQRSARALLTAGLSEPALAAGTARRDLARYIAFRAPALAVLLLAAAFLGGVDQVAAFFAAGGLLLIAGCAAFAAWLRRSRAQSAPHAGVARFGAAYARWRPTRSVLSAALIAFACFVIVSVGAFRRDPAGASLAARSGTGGYVAMAEAVVPLLYNPNTVTGRDELSLSGYDEIERARFARFRLRPGDEASCLTLYQPTNPRIIAPEAAFVQDPRFSFSNSLAATDEERANPWLLLQRRFPDGAIPAIGDRTTLTYVFHLGVGDDFVFTPDGGQPIRLRIVGALADSVLQSELIIGETNFVRLFPTHEGYRIWMIDAAEADAAAITTTLEDRLSDFGVDVTDTRARLAAYHQVENTYLSTFQALGALGLLLGTLGLAAVLARNVLERRRELGLLGAIGFTPRHLLTMVTAESLLLVGCGLAIGTVAALVAVMPALRERASTIPVGGLALLLGAVIATALIASLLATRVTTSLRIVEAVKNE